MKDHVKIKFKDDTLLLLDPDAQVIEYTAKIKGLGRKIEIKYSKGAEWSDHIVGTTASKLKDTGNGIKIELPFEDIKLKLDYSAFAELYQIMRMKVEADPNL